MKDIDIEGTTHFSAEIFGGVSVTDGCVALNSYEHDVTWGEEAIFTFHDNDLSSGVRDIDVLQA